MFKADRNLINVNFECYRLASNDGLNIREYSLSSKVLLHVGDCESTQFQVLADQLLKSYFSDDNQVLLENGQIIEIGVDGPVEKSKLEGFDGNDASMHGQFISTGSNIYHSGKLFDLPLTCPLSEYPFTIKHSDDQYLLGYQIVPASNLTTIPIPESKRGSSIFWMSVLRFGETVELVGEYYSWGRPLVARLFDESLILGSSAGFISKSLGGATSDISEIGESDESITPVFDEQGFDDEDADEDTSTSLLLRSFGFDGHLIAESPIVSFSGLCIMNDGALLIGTQCGVDVTVFKILDRSLATAHLYTLNAFAFIQSGKPHKKYTAFVENLAALSESRGSLFIYKMGSIEENVARQYLLEAGNDEILGVSIDYNNNVLVLLPEKVIAISL